jgi:hypothetical protein
MANAGGVCRQAMLPIEQRELRREDFDRCCDREVP